MSYRPKVYTASKIHHAEMWRDCRHVYRERIEFTARWINHPPGTQDHATGPWSEREKTQHWIADVQDVQRSDYVLVFCEGSDELRGSLIETGVALGLGKIVLAVGLDDPRHSWTSHPLVFRQGSIAEALNFIFGVVGL